MPTSWTSVGSQRIFTRSLPRRLAADVARLGIACVAARIAAAALPAPDWVYERFGAFQSLGWRFRRRGVPWILETNSVLSVEASEERQSVALRAVEEGIEAAAYRRCDVLVCVTGRLRDLIVEQLSITPDKIVVLPNGVDTERFNPSSTRANRFSDHFVIGWVGDMYPWAGLDMLFRATAVLRQRGKDIVLVLVGDGVERPRLEGLARLTGISEAVEFVGRIPWTAVSSHILGFDICYSGQVPVKSAGVMYHSPLKLYEYLAMGRPVLAAEHEDSARVVCHNRSGFLFPSGDLNALIDAIAIAYEARERLPELGKVGRRDVVERHSWPARVKTLISAARLILEDSKRVS